MEFEIIIQNHNTPLTLYSYIYYIHYITSNNLSSLSLMNECAR